MVEKEIFYSKGGARISVSHEADRVIIESHGNPGTGLGQIVRTSTGKLNGSISDVVSMVGAIAEGRRVEPTPVDRFRNRVEDRRHSYFAVWMHLAANSAEGEVPAPPPCWGDFENK